MDTTATASTGVNAQELEDKVKEMYRQVAENPHSEFHFEMGRAMAERLGYTVDDLDRIPAEAIDSFAGVGYYFDLAGLQSGERVLDLGSGSGMDTFVAALKVGSEGEVVGIDMTEAQRKSVVDNLGYQFLSKSAKGATEKWGVKSISLLAVKKTTA
jgi:protein-L-isoaspartate O-methyltransferase